MRPRMWTRDQLVSAVKECTSYRQVLNRLGLVEAGGNYDQIKKYIRQENLSTSHFTGMGWNKGRHIRTREPIPLDKILCRDNDYQSFKLKKRLFAAGLKLEECEICRWNQRREDGTTPLELDHINGDKRDNRLENLRVLCPNCHSLQPTHRGKNKKLKKPGC